MSLNKIDLNLFVIFEAIYSHKSITQTANVLHVTQPAVSNSLTRLRRMFDDPLFIRTPQGMTPTPYARTLIDPIRKSLNTLDDCILAKLQFEPSTIERVIRLHAIEPVEIVLLPRLIKVLSAQAPNAHIEMTFLNRREVPVALENGDLQVAIDSTILNHSQLMNQPLQSDPYVCVMRPDHPLAHQKLNLEEFLAVKHVHVSSRLKGSGHIDLALKAIAQKREIALRLQHYSGLASILLETDYVASVPMSLAEKWPLTSKPLPFEAPSLDMHIYWHKSANADPATQWLAKLIKTHWN